MKIRREKVGRNELIARWWWVVGNSVRLKWHSGGNCRTPERQVKFSKASWYRVRMDVHIYKITSILTTCIRGVAHTNTCAPPRCTHTHTFSLSLSLSLSLSHYTGSFSVPLSLPFRCCTTNTLHLHRGDISLENLRPFLSNIKGTLLLLSSPPALHWHMWPFRSTSRQDTYHSISPRHTQGI